MWATWGPAGRGWTGLGCRECWWEDHTVPHVHMDTAGRGVGLSPFLSHLEEQDRD